MSKEEVLELFRRASADRIPTGYHRGVGLFYPGTPRALPLARFARVLWQGKTFLEDEEGFIRNRWFGFDIIKGRCHIGESWLDGKPAIILEYAGVSSIFRNFRDELREISPGLLLGRFYTSIEPRKYFCSFTLEQVR